MTPKKPYGTEGADFQILMGLLFMVAFVAGVVYFGGGV